MKIAIYILSVIIILPAGCARNNRALSEKEQFCGLWECKQTETRYRITCPDGRLTMDAWNTRNGEQYNISNPRFQSGTFSATIRMKQRNLTTESKIRRKGLNILEAECSGNNNGTFLWRRIEDESKAVKIKDKKTTESP